MAGRFSDALLSIVERLRLIFGYRMPDMAARFPGDPRGAFRELMSTSDERLKAELIRAEREMMKMLTDRVGKPARQRKR